MTHRRNSRIIGGKMPPEDEPEDEHGECAAEIHRLEGEVALMTGMRDAARRHTEEADRKLETVKAEADFEARRVLDLCKEKAGFKAKIEGLELQNSAMRELLSTIQGYGHVINAAARHVRKWIKDPNVDVEGSCKTIEEYREKMHREISALLFPEDVTETRLGEGPTDRKCCTEAYARGHEIGKHQGYLQAAQDIKMNGMEGLPPDARTIPGGQES